MITVLVSKVWRIGVLTLYESEGQYFVQLVNRTYRKVHPVPPEKLDRWRRLVETGQ